jgi:hypothetical protein
MFALISCQMHLSLHIQQQVTLYVPGSTPRTSVGRMRLEDVARPLPHWQVSRNGCQLQGDHCLLSFTSALAWWTQCIDAAVWTPLVAHGDALTLHQFLPTTASTVMSTKPFQ